MSAGPDQVLINSVTVRVFFQKNFQRRIDCLVTLQRFVRVFFDETVALVGLVIAFAMPIMMGCRRMLTG